MMESSEGGAGDNASTTMNPQSLYAALGLSAEDVEALAKIPESEINIQTLPYLIMQLKAKRAEKAAATTDTDYRDKTQAAAKEAETEPEVDPEPEVEAEPKQASQEPLEKSKDKRGSPPSSSLTRRSEGHTSNHDHEHHGKGDGHRRTERPGPTGRRDSRHRKSSRERDGLGGEMELDDNPTVFPHVCTVCKVKVNEQKVQHKQT